MILGIGTDLVDVRRVARSIERFGDRFTHRICTESERTRCEKNIRPEEPYARRWAAKEACAKALGCGIGQTVSWRDMELVPLPSGQPTLRLQGGAATRMEQMRPPGLDEAPLRAHISLSDEPPYAQAFVIIEAVFWPPIDGAPHN